MNKAALYQEIVQKFPDDSFPYLADMSIQQLCVHRRELSSRAKKLEEERKAVDEYLMGYCSPAELKHGIDAGDGLLLKCRVRTNWSYPAELVQTVQQMRLHSRELGEAVCETTMYLVVTSA